MQFGRFSLLLLYFSLLGQVTDKSARSSHLAHWNIVKSYKALERLSADTAGRCTREWKGRKWGAREQGGHPSNCNLTQVSLHFMFKLWLSLAATFNTLPWGALLLPHAHSWLSLLFSAICQRQSSRSRARSLMTMRQPAANMVHIKVGGTGFGMKDEGIFCMTCSLVYWIFCAPAASVYAVFFWLEASYGNMSSCMLTFIDVSCS